ncbi:hypothetical protein TARUN_5786 [Trichoderma arundinaceum]|uniref:Heterokaryon incompatibility domain-containing protein n=1 Tax=Trichoderma arundinaceum TaxID=490622 RepID=A0A395NK59_TRIAR|nr:hypothetical protein TARUN_5786 [Trichoderma arundinaceum]
MTGPDTYPELPDSRSIRVLQLHSATNPNDAIYFDLIAISLDEPPPDEAISYTWSGQALDRPVYANDKAYLITKNEEDIMRRLRPSRPGSFKDLWIDAICINQKDDGEKSVQVKLMFEAYAKAQRVNIWLGQGSKSTALTLKWLRWYNSKRVFKTGLAELASLEYWERAWTVQEANVNGSCFILCGSSVTFRLDLFYQSHYMIPPMYIFSSLNNSKLTQPYSLHMLDVYRTNVNSEFGNEILDVLCRTKATIPKDKLFAIRGVFPDSLGALTVDYAASDGDVITEAAHIVLQETRNVIFFRYACQAGREDRFLTWVPPWTSSAHIPEWLRRFSPAVISQDAIVSDQEDRQVLKLKGLRVDKATSLISERFPIISPLLVSWSRSLDVNLAYETFVVFRDWISTIGAANNEDTHMRQLASLISEMMKLDYEEVLVWFSLIWHGDNFGMEALWDYGLSGGGQVCDCRKYTVNFLQLVSGRSFFTTDDERVGMSTLVARGEDEIVQFTGEKLPYLIHKSLDYPGKYTLVAPCWLSGAVKGEELAGWSGTLGDLEDIELV